MNSYQRARQLLKLDKRHNKNTEVFEKDFPLFLDRYFEYADLSIEEQKDAETCVVSISFKISGNKDFYIPK